MTTLSNARFNAEAAAWDANPDVHRASTSALHALLASFPDLFGEPPAAAAAAAAAAGDSSSSPPSSPPSPSSSTSSTPPNRRRRRTIDVLEIGCGTGLLSLRLAPHVSSLVAVDAAEGMVDALRLKLEHGAGVPTSGSGSDCACDCACACDKETKSETTHHKSVDDDDDNDNNNNNNNNNSNNSNNKRQRENEMLRKAVHPLCMLLQDPEDPRLPPARGHDSDSDSDSDSNTSVQGDDGETVAAAEAAAGQTQGQQQQQQPPPPQPARRQKRRRMKFDLVISHLTLHHIPGSDLAPLLRTMHGCLKPGTGWVALTDYQDLVTDQRRESLYLSSPCSIPTTNINTTTTATTSQITTPQTQTPPCTQRDTTKFHPQAKLPGVEHPRGIHATSLAALMRHDSVGFVDVDVRPAWTMRKDVERWPGEWGQEGHPKPVGDGDQAVDSMEFPFLLCRGRRRGG